MPRPLSIEEEQVLWFRARRTGLAGEQHLAKSLAAGARAVVGVQSQQLAPSLWGLAQRCTGQASAEQVREAILNPAAQLVRTWGQRDTIHLYAPEHWRAVIASKAVWSVDGRRNVMPPVELVERAREIAVENDGRVARSDLMPLIRGSYLKEAEEFIGGQMDAKRFCAGRLIWKLAMVGDLSFVEKRGAEQVYALRSTQFPQLKWPRMAADKAATQLARDYLRACGPASVQDLAHFFGARVAAARKWLDALMSECIEVHCAGREALYALAEDRSALRQAAAQEWDQWPIRLLPLWDGLLMSHADKSWTTPVEAERKLVWKKAAMVEAVVLARGRIVATWRAKQRAREVDLQITPLSAWRKTKHFKQVQLAAEGFAQHHGKNLAKLEILKR